MTLPSYERLGVFYLGRELDPKSQELGEELLYDSRDLTTHAVCIGMTGSGKTGLCLSLLEEAALDGVPAIAIDPKGDLGNLLLGFPGLTAAEFRPWINADEAARHGLTSDQYAEQQAAAWKEGLALWGQDGARIRRFRDAVDLAVYTPGSTAGLPGETRVRRPAAYPRLYPASRWLRTASTKTVSNASTYRHSATSPRDARPMISSRIPFPPGRPISGLASRTSKAWMIAPILSGAPSSSCCAS